MSAAVTGGLLIGGEEVHPKGPGFHAINPANGATLEPKFSAAKPEEVERAASLAAHCFDAYRESAPSRRAAFLETIAEGILALGPPLIERAELETGLPAARLEGERTRTVGQLRLFAAVLREGSWIEARLDPPLPDRKPLPRVDLRLHHVAVGPVAVFGASNFPLAFSVAGGDTASALAAGCPVVVKAHPAHPGTSELVGRAVAAALSKHDLPAGVFALLGGPGNETGSALVANRHIKAGGGH